MGFLGDCDGEAGVELDEYLPPPELVIQDELHLISGPLGTIAGLYETAIESLCRGKEKNVPKIVSSTATVRRATDQIRALFGRGSVQIFPPPGPNRNDSFFAVTVPASTTPARLYLGVAAQGRSAKRVLLRTYLAIMSAAYRLYLQSGGVVEPENPADPYMTMLGYFSSLRELGGTRRLIEDELTSRLTQYGKRQRLNDSDSLFVDREIGRDVQELTSRYGTDKIAAAKDALNRPFREDGGGRCGPGDEHDLGRARYPEAWSDGRLRPAEDDVRIHPGDLAGGTSRGQAGSDPDDFQHQQASRPLALRAIPVLPRDVLPQR